MPSGLGGLTEDTDGVRSVPADETGVPADVLDPLLGVAAAFVSRGGGDHGGVPSAIGGISEDTDVHSIASELEDKCSSCMFASPALSTCSAEGGTL